MSFYDNYLNKTFLYILYIIYFFSANTGRSGRMFNPGSGTNSIDTLRSRVSLKTEYVHSTQARIP